MPELNKGEPMAIEPGVPACPVCESEDTSVYHRVGGITSYICEDCGDVWVEKAGPNG